MKHAFLKLTLTTMFMLTSQVVADEVAAAQDDQTQMQMNSQQEMEPQFIEYHNRMAVFSLNHVTYERIQTDAFYAGIEAWVVQSLTNHRRDDLIGEAEFRAGYNYFYNGRDHVTPFVGIGALKDWREERGWFSIRKNRHWHRDTRPVVIYGTVGFLYDHEFTSVFNLGFNLKGIVGGGVSHRHHDWGNPVIGFDAALPITFRFGHNRHWDIRLEPFDIYLRGNHATRNFFGSRCTVGYRF